MSNPMTRSRARGLVEAFREMASMLDHDADAFDISATQCDCCERMTYNSLTEKLLYDRVIGAAERLREIAGTIERRLMPTLEGD